MKKKFWAVFDWALKLAANAGMFILFLMLISVCWEVFSRYFLGRGTVWVIEFSEYALLYMTFLGAAWLLKKEGHVEMDIVVTALQPGTRRVLKAVTSAICGLVCLMLAWSGADVALDYLERGLHRPTLVAPPAFPLFVIIPIGFFLLFVQLLRRAREALVLEVSKQEKDRVLL
jgi:TRAP-type C4-dicarboxylate transport system permease small subunit